MHEESRGRSERGKDRVNRVLFVIAWDSGHEIRCASFTDSTNPTEAATKP